MYKGAHSNNNRQKNLKKNPKNNKNYQISKLFRISKQISKKKISPKYIKIYISRKKILSALQCFLFHKKNYVYILLKLLHYFSKVYKNIYQQKDSFVSL